MNIEEIKDWLRLTLEEQSEMNELGDDCRERYKAITMRVIELQRRLK